MTEPRLATPEEMATWTPKMLDFVEAYKAQEPPQVSTNKFTANRVGKNTFYRWHQRKAGFKEHLRQLEADFKIDHRAAWRKNHTHHPLEDKPTTIFLARFEKQMMTPGKPGASPSKGCHRAALEDSRMDFDDFVAALKKEPKFRKKYERLMCPVDPDRLTLAGLLGIDTLLQSVKEGHPGSAQNLIKSLVDAFSPKRAGRPTKKADEGGKTISASAAKRSAAQALYASMLTPDADDQPAN